MRIRVLATALVTTGALMGTLTGAANADGTPSPKDDVVVFACEGGGQVAVRVRTFTRDEMEKMEKDGKTSTVPAVPAVPSGAEAGGAPGPRKDAAVRVAPKTGERRAGEAKAGSGDTDVTVAVRPEEADPAGKDARPDRVSLALPERDEAGAPGEEGHLVISEAVPVPGGNGGATTTRAETKVTLEGGKPLVTCVKER
ncbi:hypothetical protein [Streptosporangium sp. NPDC023615]|uniref:hypothetical protein n=1 Tax=Streptosporangium sp. NPDC023615 TaxID=3154794 RepID=UPI00343DA080